MTFKVGETVVYPHHGAALIEAIETRVIKGEEKTYLVLKVAQGDLTVRVPADNVDLVGVRDVVDSAGLDRVFSVLRQPYTEEPTNWSRRYKANLEKLASGDVIKVAEVVSEVMVHAAATSFIHRQMLAVNHTVHRERKTVCLKGASHPSDIRVWVGNGFMTNST